MTVELILTIISFSIFVIYNTVAISLFGTKNITSMSNTYYLYNEKKKGLGIIFTIFMTIISFTLLPAWINISEKIYELTGFNLTFLSFITSAAIIFVGAAPNYKSLGIESKVHIISAIICAFCSLLWCFLDCWQIWYVPLCGILIPGIIGLCVKGWKNCYTYWLEMMAFDATYATLITTLYLYN